MSEFYKFEIIYWLIAALIALIFIIKAFQLNKSVSVWRGKLDELILFSLILGAIWPVVALIFLIMVPKEYITYWYRKKYLHCKGDHVWEEWSFQYYRDIPVYRNCKNCRASQSRLDGVIAHRS